MAVKDGLGPRPVSQTAKRHFLNRLETSSKPWLFPRFYNANCHPARVLLEPAFVLHKLFAPSGILLLVRPPLTRSPCWRQGSADYQRSFFWSTTESASEFFADRPTAGLPDISEWCQIRDDSIALGSHFHPMFFFHDPSIDENGMKRLDLILLSMTPILVPAFHPSIDTKSYWILGPISSELYQPIPAIDVKNKGISKGLTSELC